MARKVYYEAPELLASAATYASGRKARRQNIDRSIDRQMEANVAQARLDQGDRQAQMSYERDLAALNYRAQSDQAQMALQRQMNEEDNSRMAAIADANRRATVESQAQDRQASIVEAGLKSGQFYYTPQAEQELANLNASILKVQTASDIAPDVKNKMLDELTGRQRQIQMSPAMRVGAPKPTPKEEFAGTSAFYSPSTKQFYNPGEEGIPDDAVLGNKNRNGQFVPFKTDSKEDESPLGFYGKQENVVKRRTEIQKTLYDVARLEYQSAMERWQKEYDANKPGSWDDGTAADNKKKRQDELLKSVPVFVPPDPAMVERHLQAEIQAAGVQQTQQAQQGAASTPGLNAQFAPEAMATGTAGAVGLGTPGARKPVTTRFQSLQEMTAYLQQRMAEHEAAGGDPMQAPPELEAELMQLEKDEVPILAVRELEQLKAQYPDKSTMPGELKKRVVELLKMAGG